MKSEHSVSGSIITGTGEFEHRDQYVMATVELSGGTIKSISFGVDSGGSGGVCSRLGELLTGRTVSDALEISSEKVLESCPEVCEARVHEVLLEAFHRAVEACLDQQ